MKPEQIQPGVVVYNLTTGDLYQLIEGEGSVWIRERVGRRGERSNRAGTAIEWLLQDYALWCTRCDGAGVVVEGEDVGPCHDCGGEGLIR